MTLSLYDNYLCLSNKCFLKFVVSDKMAKLSTCDIIHILQCDVLLNDDYVYDVQIVPTKRAYLMSFFHVSRKVVDKLRKKGIRSAVLFTSNDRKEEKVILTRDLDNPIHVSNGLIIL